VVSDSIELLPALSGEQLSVQFGRQGRARVVEREILPLVARRRACRLKETKR
jgi:hypothetical protein